MKIKHSKNKLLELYFTPELIVPLQDILTRSFFWFKHVTSLPYSANVPVNAYMISIAGRNGCIEAVHDISDVKLPVFSDLQSIVKAIYEYLTSLPIEFVINTAPLTVVNVWKDRICIACPNHGIATEIDPNILANYLTLNKEWILPNLNIKSEIKVQISTKTGEILGALLYDDLYMIAVISNALFQEHNAYMSMISDDPDKMPTVPSFTELYRTLEKYLS